MGIKIKFSDMGHYRCCECGNEMIWEYDADVSDPEWTAVCCDRKYVAHVTAVSIEAYESLATAFESPDTF